MSTKLAQLRERRNEVAKAAAALNEKYPADKRMEAEDANLLDQKLAEVEALDKEIDREVKAASLLNADGTIDMDGLRNKHTQHAEAEVSHESSVLRAFLTGGLNNLTEEQRSAMHARVHPEVASAMANLMPQNAMSTGVGAEGGFTTSPEHYTILEAALKQYGGMRNAARILRTQTGARMNFPTADATAEEGEIVGENSQSSNEDTVFGNATLDVYKYSSKSIALPFELIQDTFIDIEAYIYDLLGMRIGRIGNRHNTVGTGTGQPNGLVPSIGVGKVGTTGQTLNVLYDDLVDLEHSVDPAYRQSSSVGFMMHDDSLAVVRKIKDSNGRPIFVPGYEQGNPGGAPDRLLNRAVTINQHMPVMAANAKSIAFGDFSKYIIRDVMDLTLFRMTDSAYTLKGQVGFVGFMRSGGNLVDAGGAIKAYQNAAS